MLGGVRFVSYQPHAGKISSNGYLPAHQNAPSAALEDDRHRLASQLDSLDKILQTLGLPHGPDQGTPSNFPCDDDACVSDSQAGSQCISLPSPLEVPCSLLPTPSQSRQLQKRLSELSSAANSPSITVCEPTPVQLLLTVGRGSVPGEADSRRPEGPSGVCAASLASRTSLSTDTAGKPYPSKLKSTESPPQLAAPATLVLRQDPVALLDGCQVADASDWYSDVARSKHTMEACGNGEVEAEPSISSHEAGQTWFAHHRGQSLTPLNKGNIDTTTKPSSRDEASTCGDSKLTGSQAQLEATDAAAARALRKRKRRGMDAASSGGQPCASNCTALNPRTLRNRESAARSRERRQQAVLELEGQLAELRAATNALRQEVLHSCRAITAGGC